ncbi:MAG: hypothetical protein ABL309_13790 [Phycisphaerales bacterium]
MPRAIDLSGGLEMALAGAGAGLARSIDTGRRRQFEDREQERRDRQEQRADTRLGLEQDRFDRGVLESDRAFAESTRRYDQGFERGVFESDRSFGANRNDAAFQKQMQEKRFEQDIQRFSALDADRKANLEIARSRAELASMGLHHQIDQDNYLRAQSEAMRLAARESAIERVTGLQAAGVASPEVMEGLTALIEANQPEQAIELANGIAFDHFQRQAAENKRAKQASQFMVLSQDSVGAVGYDQETHETLAGMVSAGFIDPAQATLYMLQRTNPELFPRRGDTAPEGASRARGGAPEGYKRVRMAGEDVDIPQSAMAPEGGGELAPGSPAYAWWRFAASSIVPPEEGQKQKDRDKKIDELATTLANQYGGWGSQGEDAGEEAKGDPRRGSADQPESSGRGRSWSSVFSDMGAGVRESQNLGPEGGSKIAEMNPEHKQWFMGRAASIAMKDGAQRYTGTQIAEVVNQAREEGLTWHQLEKQLLDRLQKRFGGQ